MSETKIKLILTLLAFSLILPAAGFAAKTAGAKTAHKPKVVPIHYIWEYKTDLGLTDNQVSKLKDIYRGDKRNTMQLDGDYEVGQAALQSLIDKDATPDQLKAQLEKNAEIQVQLQLADILKTRSIRKLLTKDQLQSWLKIQAKINEQAAKAQQQQGQ